ncbi:heavy metal-associated isoprenylated plant protein 47 [Ziziphus jujuba]|uniref:Heavy metal-associated isoprenylated plant protein 47 n=1 Tax=Ziziphus jujuba TaxID=326968 RepID=A0ABM3IA05_ZIZJJ|nr:heavy metal-associated isoprenylated plant protein 47 [Ziziphus jujuba]
MQQKVVIELKIKCSKCRSKALKIVAVQNGITKFGFEPENRNRMVIIGDGIIDAAGLALSLRKKLGYADLVSVEEVEEES